MAVSPSGFDAVWSPRWLQKFRRKCHPYVCVPTVKMQPILSSEVFLIIYNTTRHHDPECHSQHLHYHENLNEMLAS